MCWVTGAFAAAQGMRPTETLSGWAAPCPRATYGAASVPPARAAAPAMSRRRSICPVILAIGSLLWFVRRASGDRLQGLVADQAPDLVRELAEAGMRADVLVARARQVDVDDG